MVTVAGSGRMVWPSKAVGERIALLFDFTSRLAPTESITSVTSVTASVYSGTDANPSAILNGGATVISPVVTQAAIGGVSGVIYWIVAKVATSAGETLELGGYLTVIADGAA